jgi:Putative Ig domain/Bacterial Ig domain/Dockerin type I domain/RHS Repeat/Bacterial Ig-like domain (group 2)
VSNHQVVLGQELSFKLAAADPDSGDMLTYSAKGLPDGATLDAGTGAIQWTPGAGQVGDYLVLASVTDGSLSATSPLILRATTTPNLPNVVIVQTPSFAAVPGQEVLVHVAATGFVSITNVSVTVDGKPLTLDAQGRAHVAASQPGKMTIIAQATDADGLVGSDTAFIKVRDPADLVAPAVAFDNSVPGLRITQATAITGQVADTNLDAWTLEIAPMGASSFKTVAQGGAAFDHGTLVTLDPALYLNGFYTLRLTATDVAGRTAQAETQIEIDSQTKTSAYRRTDIDLTATLDGHAVGIARQYDSLRSGAAEAFGYGWRLTLRDTNIESNAPLTGREDFGVFNPFSEGTRVYATLPDGERVGFTFAPVEHQIPGLVYYTPAFMGDAGVTWTLEGASTQLTRVGDKFYDLQTGQPYNPAGFNPSAPQYTLVGPDGTSYEINAASGVTAIDYTDGVRLTVADSGVYAPNGDAITLVGGVNGISKVIGPNGDQVVYLYDAQGNLTLVRDLVSGGSDRYGYDAAHRLTLVTGGSGSARTSIDPQTGATAPVTADLGSATNYLPNPYSGVLSAGVADQLAFAVRQSELQSTASGSLYFGVEVLSNGGAFNPAVPTLENASLVSSETTAGMAFGLYKIDAAGLELLKIAGSDASASGAYTVQVFVAGDVNRDGKVNGTDAELAFAATGSAAGGPGYVAAADFNLDGKIDATDTELLFQNLGYQANQPPVATNGTATTHEDLPVQLNVQQYISDPEGDPTFYRVVGATDGTATLSNDGQGVVFTPAAGFAGQASFQIVADDGYSTSAIATINVKVVSTALIRINVPDIGPLTTGDTQTLQVTGDYADATGVPLPISYLTLSSTDPKTVSIAPDGTLQALAAGNAAIIVSAQGIASAKAVMVSDADPTGEGDTPTATPIYAYPGAVTLLTHSGTRQLDIATDDGIDVTESDSGIRYFTSNPNVATVTADGFVTGLGAGAATITAIYDGSEADIPVLVQDANVGSTQVDASGGAVRGSDGSLVTVGPGVLTSGTTVDIEPLTQASLPMGVPNGMTYLDGFTLLLGDTPLSVPVQLAVPVPNGTPAGTTVYFFRDAQLPDATGAERPLWLLTETGTVGADGLAHSNSPPYPGVVKSGSYMVVVGQSGIAFSSNSTLVSAAIVQDSIANYGVMLGGGLAPLMPIALGPQIVIVNTYSSGAISSTTVPVVVGPSVNQSQINVEPPQAIGDADTPIVTTASIVFPDKVTPQLVITGQNLGTDPSQLVVRYRMGSQDPIDVTPTFGGNQLTASVPRSIVLGLADITVVRKIEGYAFDAAGDESGDPIEFESNPITVDPDSNLTFVVVRPTDPAKQPFVAVYGSDGQTLLQEIPLASVSPSNAPGPIAVTEDLTRAFVALGTGGVAEIDTIAMHEVNADPSALGINEITSIRQQQPDGSYVTVAPLPLFTTLDTSGDYLYAAGPMAPDIFALDTNPDSDTFGQITVIPIDKSIAPHGVWDMAVNADGTKLYATVPETELYGGYGSGESNKGHIIVVNIDPNDEPEDPALGNPDKYLQVIKTLDAGLQPYDIVATGDPDRMAFTNFLDVDRGFATIQVTNEGPAHFAATVTNSVVELKLGTSTQFYDLNIRNAAGVAVLPDQSYAFVSDWHVPDGVFGFVGSNPISGAKIGIIKDPFGPSPTYVAATMPITDSFADGIALTPDGKYLLATFKGSQVLTFDVSAIVAIVQATPSAVLRTLPLEIVSQNSLLSPDIPNSIIENGTGLLSEASPQTVQGVKPYNLGDVNFVDFLSPAKTALPAFSSILSVTPVSFFGDRLQLVGYINANSEQRLYVGGSSSESGVGGSYYYVIPTITSSDSGRLRASQAPLDLQDRTIVYRVAYKDLSGVIETKDLTLSLDFTNSMTAFSVDQNLASNQGMSEAQALNWYEVAQRLKYLGYPAWGGVDEAELTDDTHIGLSPTSSQVASLSDHGLLPGFELPIGTPDSFFEKFADGVPGKTGTMRQGNSVDYGISITPADPLVVEALKLFEAAVYPISYTTYIPAPYTSVSTSSPFAISPGAPSHLTGATNYPKDALAWLGSTGAPRWLDINAANIAALTVTNFSVQNTLNHSSQYERFGTSWSYLAISQIAAVIPGISVSGVSSFYGGAGSPHAEHRN